jgi:hypothetical protein
MIKNKKIRTAGILFGVCAIFAGLFAVDFVVVDPVLFIDEIVLLLGAIGSLIPAVVSLLQAISATKKSLVAKNMVEPEFCN